jgi:hypothetical protein
MKIDKTHWNQDKYEVSPTVCADEGELQPGFGAEIAWNTKNLLKPFLVIHFWHWRIQIGWLVD